MKLPETREQAKAEGKPIDNGSKPSDAAALTPNSDPKVANDKPAERPANVSQEAHAAGDANKVGPKVLNQTSNVVAGESASLQKAVDLEIAPADDNGLSQTLAEIHAADNGAGLGDRGGKLYSSHPISNLTIGRFQFEKTLLRLDSDDAADFDALLKKLPPMERNRVQVIDEQAAAAIVNARQESQATKEFDSSVGPDRVSRLRDIGPTVGVGKLEAFASTAHTDMNHPIGAADEVAAQMQKQADESGQSSNTQGGNADNA